MPQNELRFLSALWRIQKKIHSADSPTQKLTEAPTQSKDLHDRAPKPSTTTGNHRKNEGKQGHYQLPDVEDIDSSRLRQLITICVRLCTLAVQ